MSRIILLPVDLADEASWKKALAEALSMLGPEGVLHVASVLPNFRNPQVAAYFARGYEQGVLKALGQALAAWSATHVPEGVEVHSHVLHGTIYDEILRAADKLDVDVIVMGSHRPELKDYLLGPNAARVVRHSRRSVYVVRP